MSIQVYGIPNCGTCKKAIAWLKKHDIEYEFINNNQAVLVGFRASESEIKEKLGV